MSRLQHFFHGTNAELAVGDHIRPAGETGAIQPHPSSHMHRPEGYDAEDWAHASSSENTAWAFAERAAHFKHRGMGLRGAPPPGGTARGRVYRVEPVGQSQLGVENRSHPQYVGHDSQEHIAAAWRVVDRVDIQPPSDRVYVDVPKASGKGTKRAHIPNVWGNQGTLPLDWTQHGGDHPATANHPRQGHFEMRDAQEHINRTQFPPPAPAAREEVAGQLEMVPRPKKTGLVARRRVLKGK